MAHRAYDIAKALHFFARKACIPLQLGGFSLLLILCYKADTEQNFIPTNLWFTVIALYLTWPITFTSSIISCMEGESPTTLLNSNLLPYYVGNQALLPLINS